MAGGLNLGQDGHAAGRAPALDPVELVARVRLVAVRAQPAHRLAIRPQAEARVQVAEVVGRVVRRDDVVAEVQLQRVLLEEGHVRAQVGEELLGVEVPRAVEHQATLAPAGGVDTGAERERRAGSARAGAGAGAEAGAGPAHGLLEDGAAGPARVERARSGDDDAATTAGPVRRQGVALCGGPPSRVAEGTLVAAKREEDGVTIGAVPRLRVLDDDAGPHTQR